MLPGSQEKIVQLFFLLKKVILKSNFLLIGIMAGNAIIFTLIDYFSSRSLVRVFDFLIISVAVAGALYFSFSKKQDITVNRNWSKYILVAGIGFRLLLTVHGFIDRPEPTSDYRRNEILANQIYYNHDYLEVFGEISLRSFRPPGAPLIIAAPYYLIESRHNAHIMYSIMSFLLLYVTFLITAKSRNIFSFFYFGFIALCPSILFLGTFSSSQLPFFLTLNLIVLILINYKNTSRQLILLGILLGIGSLIRLNMVLFMPAVFLFILETLDFKLLKGIKAFAVVLLFWALAVAPWSIRNYIVQRDFVLISTNGGHVMFIANVKYDFKQAGAYNNYPEGTIEKYSNEIELSEGLKAETLDFIIENPVFYLKGLPYKMKRFLGMGYWSVDYFFGHLKHPPPDIFFKLVRKLDYFFSWLVYVAGFIFLLKIKRMKPAAFFMLTGYLIYVVLDVALFETGQRYHFPYLLFPFLAVVLHKMQSEKAADQN